MSQKAKLRVCASCEWIFDVGHQHPEYGGCPKCAFGHYGARYVYGDKAYAYAQTQKPWFDKQMANRAAELHAEIKQSQPTQSAKAIPFFFTKRKQHAAD